MMCAILGCTAQVCLLAAVLCGSPAMSTVLYAVTKWRHFSGSELVECEHADRAELRGRWHKFGCERHRMGTRKEIKTERTK